MAADIQRFPTNLATANGPGAMPAADFASSNLTATITNSGGAAVGDVVRVVSAGVLAKALADTAANAAAQVGIWNGSTVAPLNGFRTINCVAAPTVGLPLYLSAATAGKGTVIAPSLGVSPLGLVVSDVSVGAAYAALVSCPYQPIMQPSSLREKLDIETLSLLGGTPLEWEESIFDDFERTVVTATDVPTGQVANKRAPTWGNKNASIWTDSDPSSVTLTTGNTNLWCLSAPHWSRIGVSPLAYPWRLTVRLKQAANNYAGTKIDWYTDTGHAYINLQGDASGHWALYYGTDVTNALLVLGTNDGTTPMECSVASKGDGTLITKFGVSGAWSSPVSTASTAAMAARTITGGVLGMLAATATAGITQNYFYFRQKLS